MTRKDTIIISVLVNAGLLCVLFISALTSKNDKVIQPSMEVASAILQKDPNGMQSPLYDENSAEESKDHTQITLPFEPLAEEKSQLVKEEQKQILHKLPEKEQVGKIQPEQEKYIEVIVQRGDTLEKIAKRNNTNIEMIKKINHLQSSFLKEKQNLLIPITKNSEKNTTVTSEKKIYPQAEYYTVKCGDNPWTIAMKHHLKVSELLRLNNLNEEKAKRLRPGDRIRIR